LAGPIGATGPLGYAGATGPRGFNGSTGATGQIGPAGPVAGSNTQVIFNDNNSPGANANFTFNKATSVLTVIGNAIISGSITTDSISSNVELIANSLVLGNTASPISRVQWKQGTISSPTIVSIMTIPAANVTNIDYNVVATDMTTGASRQISKLMAISFFGVVDYSEYGSLTVGTSIGDFTVTAQGTTAILLNLLPTNADVIEYSVVATIYY
jgi:hypothetical protein